jgi:hypothetical protein
VRLTLRSSHNHNPQEPDGPPINRPALSLLTNHQPKEIPHGRRVRTCQRSSAQKSHSLPQPLPLARHAPDNAFEAGFMDRSFGNKKDAEAYQKRVKAKFPDEPCCLLDTGRWYDSMGRIIP